MDLDEYENKINLFTLVAFRFVLYSGW